MGIRITKEFSCDCCGKRFDNQRQYNEHVREVDSYNLGIFANRFHDCKTEQEKFEELADIFGLNDSIENVHLVFYDDDIIDCLIYGFKSGHYVQNYYATDDESTWYLEDKEIAEFIEQNRQKLKNTYNEVLNRAIKSEQDKHANTIQELEKLFKL